MSSDIEYALYFGVKFALVLLFISYITFRDGSDDPIEPFGLGD